MSLLALTLLFCTMYHFHQVYFSSQVSKCLASVMSSTHGPTRTYQLCMIVKLVPPMEVSPADNARAQLIIPSEFILILPDSCIKSLS